MENINLQYRSKVGFSFRHVKTSIEDLHDSKVNVAHAHPQFEIYYLISGNVNYHIAGQTYHVKKGEILLLNAFTSHLVEVLPNEDYERYVIEFNLDNIPTLNGITPLYDFFHAYSPIIFLPEKAVNNSEIVPTIKNMEKLCLSPTKYTNHLLLSYILNLVTQITIKLEEGEGLQELPILNKNSQTDIYINKVSQYINANMDKKITIDDIASNVHLSRSYLQHMFKDVVGMSLTNYIFRQKMHAASFMLSNGKTLQETATALGYTYYSTFSLHYKKLFGKCPKTQTR